MKESTKQFYLPHALTRCKRVAIYARVGSSRNSNERALAVQILRCCALVEQHRDWELTCIYVDCGYSGLTAERPGFKCLMLHCCAGRYDMILTFSTYQLSRKTILLLDTLNELDREKKKPLPSGRIFWRKKHR